MEERERRMRYGTPVRQNVFVSFDYDHDARLKDGLIGQSRYPNSPFNVRDYFDERGCAPGEMESRG